MHLAGRKREGNALRQGWISQIYIPVTVIHCVLHRICDKSVTSNMLTWVRLY